MTAAEVLRSRADDEAELARAYAGKCGEKRHGNLANELRALADLVEACWRKDECVCGAVPDERHTERCPLAAVERAFQEQGNQTPEVSRE